MHISGRFPRVKRRLNTVSHLSSDKSTELKVLAIIGSPKGRAGNGYQAVKNIETELNKLGSTQLTYVFLKDLNLKMCLGCFACVSRGEGLCPLKDDKAKIESLIESHDGLILSSPGYVQNVSALMKNFIERFAHTHHRPRYFDKKVLLVANGGAGLDKTLKALALAIGGPQITAKLSIISPPWPIKEKVRIKNQQKTREAVIKFHSALQIKRLPKPSLNDLLIFKFFKNTSTECKTWLSADYEYYKILRGYYYETEINPVKDNFAIIILKLLGFLMRDMGPEKLSNNLEPLRKK